MSRDILCELREKVRDAVKGKPLTPEMVLDLGHFNAMCASPYQTGINKLVDHIVKTYGGQ